MSTPPQANSEFDLQYARLNPAQRSAVDAIEGPVMVIAGPGTGKTTILTLRIANILKRTDTPASGILAITYTDAGVKAMRQKLHGIIGSRAHDVPIHTFHSFASAMIAEYPDHFLAVNDMKVMTEIEQESLIRNILSQPKFAELRPAGRPDAYLISIIRAIEDAKREAVTSTMVRQFASAETKRIQDDPASISSRGATKGKLKADAEEAIGKFARTLIFADVYDAYEAAKKEAKKLDFNDLIINLLLALREDRLLLRLIQERFLYILVDEHQDTNDAQNFIIGLLAEFFETPNIFIVGDEKQAIYRFQGASVENFLLLRKRWPAMKLISLDVNYRSHQGILDAAFGLIEKNYEGDEYSDLRVELTSKNGSARQPLEIVEAENTAAMEAYLAEQVAAIVAKEPEATVAVIVRRNRELGRIISLLESRHIPVASERSIDIFSHPVGARFFDLIEYLADPSRTDALARTVMAGMWGVSFEEGTKIVAALKSGQPMNLPGLNSIRAQMLTDNALGFLIHAAEKSGFVTLIARDPAYVHVWRGIVALAESLARDGGPAANDPLELMKNMLAYRQSAETRTVKVAVGVADAPVHALTAHGSKGLEFDYVFIPYATEEAWIGRTRGDSFVLPKKRASSSDIRDTRRLFYVALTRARKHAVILTADEELDGKALDPLRFISELDEKHVVHKHVARTTAEMPLAGQTNTSKPRSRTYTKLLDLTKRILTENGLSVTALNHYLKCPNEFLYLSVLKLPQAPSAAAEKGSAMHLALSRAWKSDDRSAEKIEAIIRESVVEYLDGSFLSVNEKQSVLATLTEDAPVVAKALEPHFAQKGTISTERWAKTTLECSYEGRAILVPLHGKLDAIVDTGSEVDVYDYKTRQAMSLAAIKGETKDGSGDYWRQLVFYAILLNGDTFWRGKKIVPALAFVSPDKKGRCPIISIPVAQADIVRVKADIEGLVEKTWKGTVYDEKCGGRDCEYCAESALLV